MTPAPIGTGVLTRDPRVKPEDDIWALRPVVPESVEGPNYSVTPNLFRGLFYLINE